MTLAADHPLRAYDAIESRLTATVSERMLELAGVGPGSRVLDLASGMGEPAVRAALRVGASGRVLGVDLHDALLDVAREKARGAGAGALELRAVDAEVLDLDGERFDAVTARWGLMSMRSPGRALAAARRGLASGGLLVAAVWAEAERIGWWSWPRAVTSRWASLPAVDPSAPGASRFARIEALAPLLEAAGFAVEHVEAHEVAVMEATTGTELVGWVRTVFRPWADAVPVEHAEDWARDLAASAESLRVGDVLQLGGTTRLVVARAVG